MAESSDSDAADIPSLPRKRFFRQRAHANVFSDHDLDYPLHPSLYPWHTHYPSIPPIPMYPKKGIVSEEEVSRMNAPWNQDIPCVKFLDVGCGFGGLLMGLSPLFPSTLMLGMEIRIKVCEYMHKKILALRAQSAASGDTVAYSNISVIRGNAQKFLPNFFYPGQLEKIFFLFPDPHFKKRKQKARIVTPTLLGDYAYVLAPGGKVYIATDVEELFLFMASHLDAHPWFEKVEEVVGEDISVMEVVRGGTEEGKKVARNGGMVWSGIWRKRTHRLDWVAA